MIECKGSGCNAPKWMRHVLIAAGIYNILFGIWCIAIPHAWFDWSGMQRPLYPQIWQFVGMIIGVYGLGYIIAATNPYRHWPIILIGFLGKIFGPIGFSYAISQGVFPLKSTAIILTNDLIWWVPFGIILWQVIRREVSGPYQGKRQLTPQQAASEYKLNSGQTLAEASQDQTVALVFLRHFGCTFTRQILRSLSSLSTCSTAAKKSNTSKVISHE